MPTTTNMTLRVAVQGGFRRDTDYDSCIVSVKLLDGDGNPTGSNLILDGDAETEQAMTQWQPGCFKYTTIGEPFTRGSQYRATYTPTLGGTEQTGITQDFYAHSEDAATSPSPSLHAYTTLQFCNIVRRATGIQEEVDGIEGQEPGSATAIDMVNDAFERVWREHRWQFQMGEPYYGPFIADQTRYQLPGDFMELIGITKPGDTVHRFEPASLQDIRRWREKGLSSGSHTTYYTIVSDPPNSATGTTGYCLEFYPTPSGFTQAAWVLDYYRQCPKVSSDTDVPPFPVGFASLLKQACRLEAFEQENIEYTPMETAKYADLLAKAKQFDGRHNPVNLGSMVQARPAVDAFDVPDLMHDISWEPE